MGTESDFVDMKSTSHAQVYISAQTNVLLTQTSLQCTNIKRVWFYIYIHNVIYIYIEAYHQIYLKISCWSGWSAEVTVTNVTVVARVKMFV